MLHELGHAVRARREGMEIDGITLWLLAAWPPSAATSRRRRQFRVAIAGPVVSL